MSTISVDNDSTIVGPNYIFNNDLINPLYIESGSRLPDSGSSTLQPLAGIKVNGTYRLSSLGKGPLSIDVLPGGEQRVAGALQVSAAGTPGSNLLPPPIVGSGVTYTLNNGVNTMFQGNVAGYAGLLFRVQPAVGFAKVTFTWFIDAALSIPVGQNSWRVSSFISTINPGCALIVAHPLRAPFLRINVQVDSVLLTADMYLAPCNNFPNKIYYPIVATEIHEDGPKPVPASGVLDYVCPFIRPGLTSVSCIVYDTTASLQFRVRKFNDDSTHDHVIADLGVGTGVSPALTGGSPAFPTALVNVPDDIWGVSIANNDTVNPHSFALHCVTQDTQ